MSLRQTSLKDFFPVVAHSRQISGPFQAKHPGNLPKGPEPGPRVATSDDSAKQTAEHGAFPFGPGDLVMTTTTAMSTGMDIITCATQNNKRKEEMDESEDEPEVKRAKASGSAGLDDAIDADDEPVYEPNPKRRKLSHLNNFDAGSAFNDDDESFADDEGDSTGSEEDDSTVVAADTNNTNVDAVFSSDSDDESFVAGEADETESESEEDNWTVRDGNESTLSFASSSTLQPSTPSATAVSFMTAASETSQHAHVPPSLVRSFSNTHISTPQVPTALDPSLPWPPSDPNLRGKAARRRRPAANFTIYEDETATPPQFFDNEATDEIRMPAVRNRVLNSLDQGQENRRPVSQPVEERIDAAQFLHETEDGSEEEVDRMTADEMEDPFEW
ncbi:hypothetical protein GJ744_002141 [Endocarpon pusillum]|uniref:Uncharacterized protein n=1 Tax=Endocarpon pusillum TaxID=364733 RepID=A0A8H7E2V6_9EURO|nr:hypothetical protein GJ744_002141 [Endocarpon pusillum]